MDNERLVEQYAEIARLAGGLAHEIKNPLSTIRLNMELLAEELAESVESPQQRRAIYKVEIVRRECLRLEELLNDFLNFARAHKLQLEPNDVNGPIREAIDFYRPLAAESKIEIIEYLSCDLPTVLLDRQSFHRAFLNLVLNAIQAMPGGGELVVRTRSLGNLVAIDLIDTGTGIDEKTLPHLFEAFHSTKRGGSGLGLPTTRKIVEAHGGNIYVQTAIDHGTQFTLTFPSLPRLPIDEGAPDFCKKSR
ncbi:MAG TPA: ATPase [Planctomycetaceae bacterium]|nr:ATPase [Planctomycetaceae bacterium]